MFHKRDIIEALWWLFGLWIVLSISSLLAYATRNVRPRTSLWTETKESLTTELLNSTSGKPPMS